MPGRASTPVLEGLRAPVVQAPMAGGPSTPALAAAVNRGGGLGFVAAAYLSTERLAQEIAATASLTGGPFGVNLLLGAGCTADDEQVAAYETRLAAEAQLAGVRLGERRADDDNVAGKIALLRERRVAVVSFAFGLPARTVVDDLHDAGSEVWLTVTAPREAVAAVERGADALVVQGVEAGGHRGTFGDEDENGPQLTLLAALQLVGAAVGVPLIAAGAITTGAALAAVLAAGAAAGQVGTAYLRSTEAGTSAAQRAATASDAPTVLTRAFTGRLARGISNRFAREHGPFAPRAYPAVHHLTSPLRAHGREVGDADLINLWAGQAHSLAEQKGAEEITRGLARDARSALAAASRRAAEPER